MWMPLRRSYMGVQKSCCLCRINGLTKSCGAVQSQNGSGWKRRRPLVLLLLGCGLVQAET